MMDGNGNSSDEEQKEKRKKEKSKMRKIKKKKKIAIADEKDPEKQKEMKKETAFKFTKIKNNLNFLANKVREKEMNKDSSQLQDVTAQGAFKKEKEKFSNANFLSKLSETEQNHGELTFGSYIILNIQNEGQNPRKF